MGDQPEARWGRYLARYHDANAGITEDTMGRSRSGGMDPYAWLLDALPAATPVVDLACGSAPLARRRPDGSWIGLDASPAELTVARAGGSALLVRADATALPLATGSVPALACSMALMVLQPLDDVLAEVHRVLTADGVAVALVPGRFPLTGRDLARYARLMVAVRRTHLGYPNDRLLVHMARTASAAGLRVVDDRRLRFALPLGGADDARRFVRSLYLPTVSAGRHEAAGEVAVRWVGTAIGVPLRRVTLRPAW